MLEKFFTFFAVVLVVFLSPEFFYYLIGRLFLYLGFQKYGFKMLRYSTFGSKYLVKYCPYLKREHCDIWTCPGYSDCSKCKFTDDF